MGKRVLYYYYYYYRHRHHRHNHYHNHARLTKNPLRVPLTMLAHIYNLFSVLLSWPARHVLRVVGTCVIYSEVCPELIHLKRTRATFEQLKRIICTKQPTTFTIRRRAMRFSWRTSRRPYTRVYTRFRNTHQYCFWQLGATDLFTEAADFSNLSPSSAGKLKVGDIKHKTYVDVNENGTEAAGVTGKGARNCA